MSAVVENENVDSFWMRIIFIVSVVVCAAVAFLILGPRPAGHSVGPSVPSECI